jgi:putative transposase
VREVLGHFPIGVRRVCGLLRLSRASWYDRHHGRDDTAIRMRLRELAQARPRFGYLRLHVMLRREGWVVNRKRVRRIYREEKGGPCGSRTVENGRVICGSCHRARAR